MAYDKQTWVPYDPDLSYDQNKANGGAVSADKLNNMETGISNAFDKTSDTIGGRNLLIGSTDNIVHYSSVTGYTVWKSYVTQFNIGDTLNVSADITSNAGSTVLKVFLASSTGIQLGYLSRSVSEGQTAHVFVSKVIPTGTASILVQIDNSNSNGIGQADVCAINHQFANTGSVVANWTPAPEDKVNVSDMRKPASDVAGIEEVSILQTQVDNSAVGINLLIGTSGDLKTKQLTNVYNSGSQTINGNYEIKLVKGQTYTYRAWLDNTNGPDDAFVNARFVNDGTTQDYNLGSGTTIKKGETGYSTFQFIPTEDGRVCLIPFAYGQSETALIKWKEEKFEKGSVATDWCPNPEDKVNVADMRKPASDVAGIEEVNAKQDKLTITPADDSKVAHLSGANNFDTVPTVKNNPLLLASSLPSDLARTGQDTNFTGKLQQNGQDVALVNNTIARNPDTGSVSETNIFTAAQTFSIAPTITDASKDKGDNQAATMADLKSVENSSWLSFGDKMQFSVDEGNTSKGVHLYDSNTIYKLSPEEGKIYLAGGVVIYGTDNDSPRYYLTFDFSDIASKISLPNDTLCMTSASLEEAQISGNTKIYFNPQYSGRACLTFRCYDALPYVNYTPKS